MQRLDIGRKKYLIINVIISSRLPKMSITIMTADCGVVSMASHHGDNHRYHASARCLDAGNHRRAFQWEKYRRSAGDSCIANEPPENSQWNTPSVTAARGNRATSRPNLARFVTSFSPQTYVLRYSSVVVNRQAIVGG